MTPPISTETGWRDIASVPKDGTWFVAARFVQGCKHVRYGYAKVDRWHGHEINPDDRYEGMGHFNQDYWPATHWCPLPTPPKESPNE